MEILIMKLINKEIENELSSNKSDIREKLLEEQLEELNKQLIVYMPIMILCMLKIKELKNMLKEMVLFFVLQLLEIVLVIRKYLNILNISTLARHLPEFQFSVSGSGFSVLVPTPGKFNSLYRASASLKNLNKNSFYRISTNYNQVYKRSEFTHDALVMSKLLDFLPMMTLSFVKSGPNLPMSHLSCKENAQNLYMRKLTCIENATFLCISFFNFLFSLFI